MSCEFWYNIKQRDVDHKLYVKYLRANTFLSQDMEEMMEKRKPLSPEQKCTLLIQFVEQVKRVPTSTEVVDGVNLGGFWHRIKQKGV